MSENDKKEWKFQGKWKQNKSKIDQYRHHLVHRPETEEKRPIIVIPRFDNYVHVNSSFVVDSYYDTLYKLRHDHLNEKMFRKVVKDSYTANFHKEIARIKEENYYLRYAIELFIER
jgi:hypothetical protein